MVILIGGSSHVGKTMIAHQLMCKYQIPYVSLDHLKMGFIRTHMTTLTVEEDLKIRYYMWPFVAEIIKTAIENDQNLILEGCYIPSEWKDSFSADYRKNIHSVFIVMSEKYIKNNFEKIVQFQNVIEKRKDQQIDMERLIACSKDFKDECLSSGTPVLEIEETYDTDNIIKSIEKLLELK